MAIAGFILDNYGANLIMSYIKDPAPGKYVAMKNDVFGPFGDWWLDFEPGPSCKLFVYNPLHYVMQKLNSLMLISSMRSATSHKLGAKDFGVPLEKAQATQTDMRINSIIYVTNWWFGAAAMITVFICILCVLPNYWGFWQLGRKVTLGPIEIANAFQAPVLDHPNVSSRGEVKDIVSQIGDRPVQYGEVAGQNRLGVAGPSEVKNLRLPGPAR